MIGFSPETAPSWKPANVEEVSALIANRAKPGSRILSLWPGYLLGVPVRSLHGAENHFGLLLARTGKVGEARLERYRIASWSRIRSAILRREIDLVAVVSGPRKPTPLEKVLRRSGYSAVERSGVAKIYEPAPSPPAPACAPASRAPLRSTRERGTGPRGRASRHPTCGTRRRA